MVGRAHSLCFLEGLSAVIKYVTILQKPGPFAAKTLKQTEVFNTAGYIGQVMYVIKQHSMGSDLLLYFSLDLPLGFISAWSELPGAENKAAA